jgi:hypothetical protein
MGSVFLRWRDKPGIILTEKPAKNRQSIVGVPGRMKKGQIETGLEPPVPETLDRASVKERECIFSQEMGTAAKAGA